LIWKQGKNLEETNMYLSPTLRNERGSALIVALLMLVVLTLIGISASTTTTFELQISGNDKLYKMAFYQADGATEAGSELIEQNIEERDWTATVLTARGNIGIICIEDGLGNCINREHYLNDDIGTTVPADTNRHAVIPANPPAGAPHTNILMGGDPVLSTGSAVLLASGYEGMGKGAGGGGVWLIYDVRAQHEGVRNSASLVNLQWRHVM
jgi:hypothetical protein